MKKLKLLPPLEPKPKAGSDSEQPNFFGAQIVKETVDDLGAAMAVAEELGSTEDKFRMLLGAIASKCALCVSDAEGRSGLNRMADCGENACPLHEYGTSVFQCVRAKLEFFGAGVGRTQ